MVIRFFGWAMLLLGAYVGLCSFTLGLLEVGDPPTNGTAFMLSGWGPTPHFILAAVSAVAVLLGLHMTGIRKIPRLSRIVDDFARDLP